MEIFKKPGRDWTKVEIVDAFSYFTENYLDNLIRFAYGYMKIGVSNKERAHELAKDVVAKKLEDAFHHYLHTYDPKKYRGEECPFRNWVEYMVAREAVKVSRQEGKIAIIPEEKLEIIIANKARNISIPDFPMAWKEIEPYLDRLSPRYQEALEFKKKGLPHHEAARQSRWLCKKGAMKVRICRAQQELIQLIENIDKLPFNLRQAYILIEVKKKLPVEATRIAQCTEDEMKERLDQAIVELNKLEKAYGERR